MKGKALKLICVGKLKREYWRMASEHYLALLRKWRPLEYRETKDTSHKLERNIRIMKEGISILDCLSPADKAICLDERGKTLTSFEFAEFLRLWDMKEQKTACFIIGGPYGLDTEVQKKCALSISLSPMTWPHELARVMLLEQLFRAESILRNFPYHN